MARITTGCHYCGRVELAPDDITLFVTTDENEAWYQFDCIGCGHQITKPAPPTVSESLKRVRTPTKQVPLEFIECQQAPQSGPLTIDDLLDAILFLRSGEDKMQRALAKFQAAS